MAFDLPTYLRLAARTMAETGDTFPTGQGIMNDAADEIERLTAALATARRDALDEAAKFIENNAYTSTGCETSMQPVSAKFHGMDRHHATIALALRALAELKVTQ